MSRKTNNEDRTFLTFDEPIEDKPAILAAVSDAESKDLYEYGLLTHKFYIIMQNGMINTCVNRSSFIATETGIEKILNKIGRTRPKIEYQIAKFNDTTILEP